MSTLCLQISKNRYVVILSYRNINLTEGKYKNKSAKNKNLKYNFLYNTSEKTNLHSSIQQKIAY